MLTRKRATRSVDQKTGNGECFSEMGAPTADAQNPVRFSISRDCLHRCEGGRLDKFVSIKETLRLKQSNGWSSENAPTRPLQSRPRRSGHQDGQDVGLRGNRQKSDDCSQRNPAVSAQRYETMLWDDCSQRNPAVSAQRYETMLWDDCSQKNPAVGTQRYETMLWDDCSQRNPAVSAQRYETMLWDDFIGKLRGKLTNGVLTHTHTR